MSFESEYKVHDVSATRVAADKIDATFRSSTIGEFKPCLSFCFRRGVVYSHVVCHRTVIGESDDTQSMNSGLIFFLTPQAIPRDI
jgi:hypothetical protein